MKDIIRVGFLGAGGFARVHAYALETLKYYYDSTPKIEKVWVASPTPTSREAFAARFNFQQALHPESVWERQDIDTLFILGSNHTHTPHLLLAADTASIKRIYVEKPIGTSPGDIQALEVLNSHSHGKFIMTGFQFLQKSALREALAHWRHGIFGKPCHFRAEYLHSSYLDPAYRQKQSDKLAPIPINGAAADLGSHALSLLIAFLGNNLKVKAAAKSGGYDDVPVNSDLCTTALLEETSSGAIGTMVASRISPGTGDRLILEIFGSLGALLFDTAKPDCYQSYLPEQGWRCHETMSNYLPGSKFPSDYVPSGWLRALIHNHYLFLGGESGISVIPDLAHGISVQKLLQATSEAVLAK